MSLNQSAKGTAEFFLLISPGKVEQVKFIKGDDELKSFTETLQKTDLRMKFPPDTQVQAVRRAVVHCGSTAPGPARWNWCRPQWSGRWSKVSGAPP